MTHFRGISRSYVIASLITMIFGFVRANEKAETNCKSLMGVCPCTILLFSLRGSLLLAHIQENSCAFLD